MFGMENQKKKTPRQEFVFELEKELQDLKHQKALSEQIGSKVDLIKHALRDGSDKEMFQHYGTLLNGYAALVKVLSRTSRPAPSTKK